jgi:hypothetical protein
MPGLKDVAKSFRSVTVRGTEIEVPGIGSEAIAYLFHRFPVVREMMGGRDVSLTAEAISKLAPEAVAAIIAAGTGNINDPEAEAIAAKLPLEAQLDLLEAIIGETMPSGPGPFMEKATRILGKLGDAGLSTSIPGTSSQTAS